MGKRLGFALVLVLLGVLPASAEMATGKVKEVDKAGQAVVLEDGTRLIITNTYVTELVTGDLIRVIYEVRGDQKIATEIDRRAKMMDGSESTNFGARGN